MAKKRHSIKSKPKPKRVVIKERKPDKSAIQEVIKA